MHPYESLDPSAFWSSAVAKRNMFDIDRLWNPKFPIARRDRVLTFGSCFAQHIGRALQERGFNWTMAEPAPPGLSEESARHFNYGIFSARTGNIYTVSLLQQWVRWSLGKAPVPDEIWQGDDGRFHDPFRPVVEPGGFASAEEVRRSRELTIEAFRTGLQTANVLVFTLGLTESWFNREHGYEYPMCPGTAAGKFDAAQHLFVNQRYAFIRKTLAETIRMIQGVNPRMKFLLTVSPVPLTATMSGNHVLVATMESKSTLRAVAGQLASQSDAVDYFPSYEIINATPYRGSFFEPNQRNVNHAGVAHVMKNFFECLDARFPLDGPAPARGRGRAHPRPRPDATAEAATAVTATDARPATRAAPRIPGAADAADVVCEEELLGAFAPGQSPEPA